LDFQVGVKV